MRLRDLRWYILASIILIVSYAAIAVCYYLPVRAKAENSMKVLGLEATENVVEIATSEANALYDIFMNDSTFIDTKFNQSYLSGKFYAKNFEKGERRIIIARDNEFVYQSSNTSYYFYFLNDEDLCGRVSLQDIFSFLSNTEEQLVNFNIFVHDKAGAIYYNNFGTNELLMSNVLQTSSFILLNEADEYNGTYKVFEENGVLSGISFFDVYLSLFIPVTDPYLAIDWVVQQAIIFYTIGIIVIIAMLFILILGCRKASKLLRVDRHALQATKAIVIRIDTSGKVIFTNKTFKQLYGITKLENVDNILDVETGEGILQTVKQNKAFECSIAIKNDEDIHYFHLSPLKVASSYYLMGTDITIDYKRRKHLFLMSGRNDITNCDNGFSLTNNYEHILLSSAMYDIAFVEYNIAKYEEIVGVFGRNNFNILLNEFLSIIQQIYTDLAIYHINDSKFIVVYPNLKIEEVIEKINESLEILRRPFQIKQNHIYIKCKVVVYNLKKEEAHEIDLQEIQSKLELALKNILNFSAKDYIVYDSAMDTVIASAEEMEKDLVKGLQNDEFKMYLQPQFDIVANRIDGFEALIRWTNPKYIDKSPQAFIELAEQRGYILDVGRYVIKETFRLAKKLEPYNIHISMNVSPIQLLQVGFVQQLIDEFKVLRLKPGSIAIEITETFLMGNFQLMVEKLKRLKEMGFAIHLDDFCTGYSSMLYLKDLPVDALKIDIEFTKYIETSKVHANIVRTICSLAESLDMDIICEGIENQHQSDIVKKYGARLIQGYLIGKALPLEQAIEILEKYNGKKK